MNLEKRNKLNRLYGNEFNLENIDIIGEGPDTAGPSKKMSILMWVLLLGGAYFAFKGINKK